MYDLRHIVKVRLYEWCGATNGKERKCAWDTMMHSGKKMEKMCEREERVSWVCAENITSVIMLTDLIF